MYSVTSVSKSGLAADSTNLIIGLNSLCHAVHIKLLLTYFYFQSYWKVNLLNWNFYMMLIDARQAQHLAFFYIQFPQPTIYITHTLQFPLMYPMKLHTSPAPYYFTYHLPHVTYIIPCHPMPSQSNTSHPCPHHLLHQIYSIRVSKKFPIRDNFCP